MPQFDKSNNLIYKLAQINKPTNQSKTQVKQLNIHINHTNKYYQCVIPSLGH